MKSIPLISVFLSGLLLAACAGEPTPPVLSPAPDDPGVGGVYVDPMTAPASWADGSPAGFCDLLPSEGPCSLACDPEALAAEYGITGLCVTVGCELTTGEHFMLCYCAVGQ